MIIGYARVHMRDRALHLQRAALSKVRCDYIIEVAETGRAAHRRGLNQTLNLLRAGDTLVVRRLDRLATTVRELMAVSATLQERNITLRVLEADEDAGISSGEVVDRLLAALADYRRARNRSRPDPANATDATLIRRRGRPPGIDEAKREAVLALRKEAARSITEICSIVGISRPTFYRYMRRGASEGA